MLEVQERELEAVWFIKRIPSRVVCVYRCKQKGYRKFSSPGLVRVAVCVT